MRVEIRVHPRISKRHPEISEEDVKDAFINTLASIPRMGTGFPSQWLGVGLDGKGRLLQYVAISESLNSWLVFHAMAATSQVLKQVGLKG